MISNMVGQASILIGRELNKKQKCKKLKVVVDCGLIFKPLDLCTYILPSRYVFDIFAATVPIVPLTQLQIREVIQVAMDFAKCFTTFTNYRIIFTIFSGILHF